VDWIGPDEEETQRLRYSELDAADIEWAKKTVAAMPPISRDQWERIARTLGLELATNGSEPIGDGHPGDGRGDDEAPEQVPHD
jgi:hypothetical protein